jgi:hypothetical protein
MGRDIVLLYANNIHEFNPETHVKRGVVAIDYDYNNIETPLDFFTILEQSLSPKKKISRIGFMCHTQRDFTLSLFKNDILRNTYKKEDFNDFILFCSFLKEKYGITDLDLIACSVTHDNDNVLTMIHRLT